MMRGARRGFVVSLLTVAMAAAVLLSGCGKTFIGMPQKPVAPQSAEETPPVLTPEQVLRTQAEAAWNAGNMREVERLYGIIAHAGVAPGEVDVIFSRFVQGAVSNRHGIAALDALELWKKTEPGVEKHSQWQQMWGQGLMLTPPSEAQRRANAVASDAATPITLRAQGASVLMLLAPDTDKVRWMEALNSVYGAGSVTEKASMERGLAAVLPAASPYALNTMISYSLPDTDHSFPWSVLLLEQARRDARGKTLPAPTHIGGEMPDTALSRINAGIFADTTLFTEVLQTPSKAESTSNVSPVTLNSGCVALALPLSGKYAMIGKKVARGAEAGKAELAQRNVSINLMLIDTDAPDWLDKLAALPPACAVVGGPLLPDAYVAAKARGALTNQAFFTFLSSLDDGDEGVAAWRFFSSPQDQITSMMRVAQDMGITSYGILAPEETYGHRMSDLFMQSVGSSVSKSATYNPADPQSWNAVAQRFVGGGMIGKTPVSSARFQAAFLPDAWDKSSIMVPYLFFHGEDRLLLLGTALWEQGLSGQQRVSTGNFGLAVFPGAWNPAATSGSAAALQSRMEATGGGSPDLWTGLGYDFVRFTSALNLKPGWIAADVNRRIQEAQRLDWSMAPLSWSLNGQVQQDMFVFTPAENGFVLADMAMLRARLEHVRKGYDRRISSAKR